MMMYFTQAVTQTVTTLFQILKVLMVTVLLCQFKKKEIITSEIKKKGW
jgi:hypothetical protein